MLLRAAVKYDKQEKVALLQLPRKELLVDAGRTEAQVRSVILNYGKPVELYHHSEINTLINTHKDYKKLQATN